MKSKVSKASSPVSAPKSTTITIKAPNFAVAEFTIRGTAPLVIHRFSAKTKREFEEKMMEGTTAKGRKKHGPKDLDELYNDARYISQDGWDGFHAGAIRNAMISACRLINYKMTLMKLSCFVEADGRDAKEPQIPLIRIHGKPIRQDDIARVETGQPYLTIRPAYHDWSAKVRIRFDADQFTGQDVANLLSRVGVQVGIGEGRPDSKNSAGMGWGTFEVL